MYSGLFEKIYLLGHSPFWGWWSNSIVTKILHVCFLLHDSIISYIHYIRFTHCKHLIITHTHTIGSCCYPDPMTPVIHMNAGRRCSIAIFGWNQGFLLGSGKVEGEGNLIRIWMWCFFSGGLSCFCVLKWPNTEKVSWKIWFYQTRCLVYLLHI